MEQTQPELFSQADQLRSQESAAARESASRKAAPEDASVFQLAVTAMCDLIFDCDVRTQAVSRTVMGKDFFGYSQDQLGSGMQWWREVVHPDDQERVLSELDRMMRGDASRATAVYRLKDAWGNIHWVEDLSLVFRDERGQPVRIVGGTRDITERKALEQQLVRATREAQVARDETNHLRAELEAVLMQMPVGVVIAEAPSGKMTMVNPKILELAQGNFAPSQDLNGYAQYAGLHPDGTPMTLEDWPLARTCRTGERVVDQRIRFPEPGGRTLEMECSSEPVYDASGKLIAAVMIAHDVTAELRAAEELERSVKDREELIGMVSHDLRNPLHAIALSSAMLEKLGPLSEGQKKAVHRIDASVDRMKRLISDLLDYEKSRTGLLPIHPKNMDFASVVGTALEELRAAWPDRNIQYFAPEKLIGVWDPERVKQLVVNLVSNALIHGSPHGPVSVSLREHPATPSQRGFAELEVHNEGPAIPALLLQHLFDRNARPKEAQAQVKGTGFGVSIVQAVLKASGGTVSVDSQQGQGTTFTVRLPLSADAQEKAAAAAKAPQ